MSQVYQGHGRLNTKTSGTHLSAARSTARKRITLCPRRPDDENAGKYVHRWWHQQQLEKKLSAELDFRFFRTFQDVRTAYNLSFEAEYRPLNTLVISLEPEWSRTNTRLQYVATRSLTSGVNTPRYIFASIDQKILSMSLRVDYNITPDLTIQYWGQPFFGSGSYSEFKRITDPVADEFSDRYEIFGPSQIGYISSDSEYVIDENQDLFIDYRFSNPDFTVSEFLHNLVVVGVSARFHGISCMVSDTRVLYR
ncbi:MAG: DUF5916 domain-containing protein [Bacteroidales bacterium]